MAFGKIRGNRPTASRGNSGDAFAPVEPGYYLAVVKKATLSTFTHTFKGAKGKFTYHKLTPEFRLLNDAGTIISRQDIILGTVDDEGYLFRPDGNDEKPALFSEAGFFLSALGFVDDEGLVDYGNFAPDLIVGQVIRVKVENEDYEKDGEIKTKNKIVGFYAVRESDIEDNDLYADDESGMVFISQEAADTFHAIYDDLLAAGDDGDPF